MMHCPNIYVCSCIFNSGLIYSLLSTTNLYRQPRPPPSLNIVFAEKSAGTSVLCFCSTVPLGDAGSLAMDPSLLMVLITKFFSRVKFVRPTLSELSMTNTMSRAPQRFSQSETREERRVNSLKGWGSVWSVMMFAHHSNRMSPWYTSWHHSPAVTGMRVTSHTQAVFIH